MSEPVNAFPSRVRWVGRRELLTSRPVRRAADVSPCEALLHPPDCIPRSLLQSGESIPDDVSVPGRAEKYRIRDEQGDESDSRKSHDTFRARRRFFRGVKR